MRRLAIILAPLAVLASLAFSSPASASTHDAPARRSCTSSAPECVHWNAYVWGFKAKWLSNVHGYYERGHTVCQFRSGGVTKTIDGGWVTSLNLYSNAPCPGSGWTMLKGGYQAKASANGSISTYWEYP